MQARVLVSKRNQSYTAVPLYQLRIMQPVFYDDMNKLQHRAMRTFLGVGKQTSLVAFDGETGLNSLLYRKHCDIIRFWHRLSRLPSSRVAHRVLTWDISKTAQSRDPWSADVKQILEDKNLTLFFEVDTVKNVSCGYIINRLNNSTRHKLETSWKDDLQQSPNMRTYQLFKDVYINEPYLDSCR